MEAQQQLLDFDSPPRASAKQERRTSPPRRRIAVTSLAAYAEAEPKLSERAVRVLDHVRSQRARGATNHEIHEALGIPYASTPSITGRLRDVGRICDSGQTRPTDTGCPAAVWIATATEGAAS